MKPSAVRVFLLCSVLLLTACSSIPATVPASPTATADAPQLVANQRPASRVPLACGAFSTVVADTMHVQHTLLDEQSMTFNDPADFAELQSGMLSCFWESSTAEQFSPPWLGLKILPDATADFAAQQPSAFPQLEEAGLFGPGSRLLCPREDVGAQCEMSFLADGYWVFLWLRPLRQPADDAPDSRDLMVAAGQTIGELLEAAGPPSAAYGADADSLGAWKDCDEIEAGGSLATALDSPTLTLQSVLPEDNRAMGEEIVDAVLRRVDFESCSWQSEDGAESDIIYASVSILEGGGWALSELSASDLHDGLYYSVSSVDVAGADEAIQMCSDHTGCDVHALVDGSYVIVHLFFDASDRGDRSSAIEAATEHLIAALTRSD